MDRHGGLHTGSTETIATVTGGIVAAGQPYEVVHPGDARLAAFGAVLGDHEPAVFEPAAGMMWPSQVRAALAEAARTAGAALYDHTTVTAIEPLPGDRVRVHVFDGHSGAGYTDCDRVVLAGGPWAFRLAPAAAPAFAITRRFQLICRTDEPLGDGRPRPWIDHAGVGYYGMINVQPRTHLVGLHELDREQPVADPGEPDDTAVRADSVAQSLEYAMHRFALSREPTVVEVRACHYTSTASRDFTIDDCPGLPGVILLSPCSGHGFKFTVTVGDYAVRLAHAEEFPHRSRFAVQLATMS
jgi:sarcosine oxidase